MGSSNKRQIQTGGTAMIHGNRHGNQFRRPLAKCRAEIGRFPLRSQTRLLHEFEEAETRLSVIGKAASEAIAVLRKHDKKTASGAQPRTRPSGTAEELLRMLRASRDKLQEQLCAQTELART